tara:strand:+ start:26075 stop:26962 length:888 start_codon:yes stop_codon:yes gene_type:complete
MIKLSCPISLDDAELVDAWIYESESSSWELFRKKVNDPTYLLSGYFTSEEEARAGWSALHEAFPNITAEPTKEIIEDEDWQDAYKAYLKPWSYQELHWVPLYQKEDYTLPNGDVCVYVDAGMAFGTGTHETTQLCAMRLMNFYEQHKADKDTCQVIDAGCGSGILAISAAKLGFKNIHAFDIDPDAIRVSEENLECNATKGMISLETAGLDKALKETSADLLLANIQTHILKENADVLLKAMKPQGTLILSGILLSEQVGVKELFEEKAKTLPGHYSFDSRVLGEWTDVCIQVRS